MSRRAALLLVLAGAGTAAAQPRAVGVSEPVSRDDGHPDAGLGADLVVGWGGQLHGPSGWVARLEYEVFPVFVRHDRAGVFFGFQPGLEIWRSGEDNWGGSVPFAMVFGARLFPMRATIGIGADAMLVDQVADDTGFGMWAPFGMARIGADIHGVQLGADARIGYRWQIGAPDHTRWQLGIYAGGTWESPPRNGPVRMRRAGP